MRNALYYGDNLDVLRRHLKDESVDLVYLDPPFNSNQDYNVLFKGQDGTDAPAQIKAFEDTWHFDRAARLQLDQLIERGDRLAHLMDAFLGFLGMSDMMAYLTMMAPRLVELRRVMKPTASIYLHCDPTASHYLKLVMDAVFGPENFRNEIVWKRTSAHSSARRFGSVHDIILFYSRGQDHAWHGVSVEHDPQYVEDFFRQVEPGTGRRFHANVLTGPGVSQGDSGKPWRGYDPSAHGRHWALPQHMLTGAEGTMQQKLDALETMGRIYWPQKEGGSPRLKYYADELKGSPAGDVWADIGPISGHATERLGYPTQKPEALLERIIRASSNDGDVVLDPFCGCGTAVAVAQRLNRKWVGIDITHLAISLMKHRLSGFGITAGKDYDVVGEPTTVDGARELAEQDPYQFQWWALGLVGARPVEERKGADKGIDGRRVFFERQGKNSTKRQIIFSVKAGAKIPAHAVRDLRGTMEREKADFGVLLSMAEPTRNMQEDALAAGSISVHVYDGERKYPRLQCITISALMAGHVLDLPPFAFVGGDVTLKAAPERAVESAPRGRQKRLLDP